MELSNFLQIPEKRGTFISLVASGKTDAAASYLICWTDCQRDDAEQAVDEIQSTQDYATHLEAVKRYDAARRRGIAEYNRQIQEAQRKKAIEEALKAQSHTVTHRVPKIRNRNNKTAVVSHTKKHTLKKNLYLIDGDNHIKEAISRIGQADNSDQVIIYVSQNGLFKKLQDKKYPHVELRLIKPGDQAVDNAIISDLTITIKNGDGYEKYCVISQDKGFQERVQKLRCTFGKKKNVLNVYDVF